MNLTHLKRQLEDAKKISTTRTVILWGQKDLLGEAVEALLTDQGDWQVIRLLDEQGIEAFTQATEEANPELMVVNQASIVNDIQPLLQLIKHYPALKIITVNPENNLVEVYDKHRVQIKDIADLLSIISIHECPHPSLEGGEDQP